MSYRGPMLAGRVPPEQGRHRPSEETCVVEMHVELTRTRTIGNLVSIERTTWSAYRHESAAATLSVGRCGLTGHSLDQSQVRGSSRGQTAAIVALLISATAFMCTLVWMFWGAPSDHKAGATTTPIPEISSSYRAERSKPSLKARAVPAVADPHPHDLAAPPREKSPLPAAADEERLGSAASEKERQATLLAFRNGTVESWADGGVQQLVMASPPQRGNGENCRRFTYWRPGDEQGSAESRTLCLEAGNLVPSSSGGSDAE
jgi:hypothetical protein